MFSEKKGAIKAVVTDMMMPVMGGSALIEALHKLDPHVRIIAVSGLIEGNSPPPSSPSRQITFLQKPFSAEKLLETLHEVLHSAQTPLLL